MRCSIIFTGQEMKIFLLLFLLQATAVRGDYFYLGKDWTVASNPFRLDLVSLPTTSTSVAALPKACTSNADLLSLMESTGDNYCAGIVTWDVWANGPFAVTDAQTLAAANTLAKSFYSAAKPLSFLNEGADARAEKSQMQGPCLSYMSYWGCLAAFPNCEHRDPYNAQCKKACAEFNSRCSGTEGKLLSAAGSVVDCGNYPESDCSAAAGPFLHGRLLLQSIWAAFAIAYLAVPAY